MKLSKCFKIMTNVKNTIKDLILKILILVELTMVVEEVWVVWIQTIYSQCLWALKAEWVVWEDIQAWAVADQVVWEEDNNHQAGLPSDSDEIIIALIKYF